MFGDVACSSIIVCLLWECQRLFGGDKVGTIRNLIKLAVENSRFCKPSKRFRELIALNEVKLRVSESTVHLFVISRFLRHIQIVSENALKWRLVENFVELIETVKCGHKNDEVVSFGSAVESNAGNWSIFASSDVKNLEQVGKFNQMLVKE